VKSVQKSAKKRRWYDIADEEACAVRASLPPALQEKLRGLAVTLDPRPTPDEEQQEGDDEALLGLFVGPCFGEELGTADPMPPAIRLFVENLRDEAEDDPVRFRQEVRTTLLHEIGHYLGLDEDELSERGLA
jgi:predicted Zn-dependent protease with MMP-like domain